MKIFTGEMERLKMSISRIALLFSIMFLSGCTPLIRQEISPTPALENCETSIKKFELGADLYTQIQITLLETDLTKLCNDAVILNPFLDVGVGYRISNEGIDISKIRGVLHLTFKYAFQNNRFSLVEINPMNAGFLNFNLGKNVEVIIYEGDTYGQINVSKLETDDSTLNLFYIIQNENSVKTFDFRIPMQVDISK